MSINGPNFVQQVNFEGIADFPVPHAEDHFQQRGEPVMFQDFPMNQAPDSPVHPGGIPAGDLDNDPFLNVMNDEGAAIITEYDVAIQRSIHNRVETNLEKRRRLEDDMRGFEQKFELEGDVPLFYNEPPEPAYYYEIPAYDLPDNLLAYENEIILEQEPDWNFGSIHNSGDSADSGFFSSPNGPMGYPWTSESSDASSGTNSPAPIGWNGQLQDTIHSVQSLDINQENFIDPWVIMAGTVMKYYQPSEEAVSDSGLLNAEVNKCDKWKRVGSMHRFKVRNKALMPVMIKVGHSRKRKAFTEPAEVFGNQLREEEEVSSRLFSNCSNKRGKMELQDTHIFMQGGGTVKPNQTQVGESSKPAGAGKQDQDVFWVETCSEDSSNEDIKAGNSKPSKKVEGLTDFVTGFEGFLGVGHSQPPIEP